MLPHIDFKNPEIITSPKFRGRNDKEESIAIINTFIDAFRKLDGANLELIFFDADWFEQTDEVQKFYNELYFIFLHHRRMNQKLTNILVSGGICSGCSLGKQVKVFTMSYSNEGSADQSENTAVTKQYAFLFEVHSEVLQGIHQCFDWHNKLVCKKESFF